MKKWLLIITIAVLAITGWKLRPIKPVPIQTYEVTPGTVERIAANSRAGTIKACQRSQLSLRTGGRVSRLLTDEGQRVKKGALLLELQNDEEQVRVELARSDQKAARIADERSCGQASLAKREAIRAESLASQKLISTERLDQQRTEAHIQDLQCRHSTAIREHADMALKLAEVQLEQTRLYAPFAGIVGTVNAEVGEFATPSSPGVSIPPAVDLIDDSCLYVEAPIDEVEASHVTIGQHARITLDAFRGQIFQGTVGRTAATISAEEKQARTLLIDTHFTPLPEDANLLVGYSADVEVITDLKNQVLRIPTEAILNGSEVYRYKADNQSLESVQINTGLSNWTWTEVLSGLNEGDLILSRIENISELKTAKVQPQSSSK